MFSCRKKHNNRQKYNKIGIYHRGAFILRWVRKESAFICCQPTPNHRLPFNYNGEEETNDNKLLYVHLNNDSPDYYQHRITHDFFLVFANFHEIMI